MDDLVLRPLRPDEAPALARLAERLFRATYAPTHGDWVDPYCAQAFAPGVQERELAEPGAAVLVVEHAGEPVAYAQLRRRPAPAGYEGLPAVEIARFYVDARWHGRGVAQRLMAAALAHAWGDGARVVWLQVAEYNDRALAFYRKVGYRDIGRVPFDFAGLVENDWLLAIEPAPDGAAATP